MMRDLRGNSTHFWSTNLSPLLPAHQLKKWLNRTEQAERLMKNINQQQKQKVRVREHGLFRDISNAWVQSWKPIDLITC
ncbi:hypothetical protein VCR3J2_410099 [Vibrio coralliirubri]|nr:hypothetical protein VCR3J2_410099 [Vibrio coralliirubri]